MQFHAYVFFSNGRCREALERYQQILGGELEIMRFDQLPEGEEAPVGADQADLVMHAALTVDGGMLMGSDDPSGDGGPMRGVAVHLTCADAGEAERVFGELTKDGEVTMPMEQVFWAERFGMGVDQFGLPWMVSTP
jgi:PhnB protein